MGGIDHRGLPEGLGARRFNGKPFFPCESVSEMLVI